MISGGTRLMMSGNHLLFPTQEQPENGLATLGVMMDLAFMKAVAEIDAMEASPERSDSPPSSPEGAEGGRADE